MMDVVVVTEWWESNYTSIEIVEFEEYYKEYQSKPAKMAGSKESAVIIKDAIYVLGAGSGDIFRTTMSILYLTKSLLLNNIAQSLSAHSQVLLRYLLNLKYYNS